MSRAPQIVDAKSIAPQPWRNGGGRTRELLAWPDGADWTLRVSVADIERDGPFSPFPGVERWFAVLAGAGVALRHAARQVRLELGDAPWRFDGDDAPDCRLIDGATRDLNLMIRRDRGQGEMRRVEPGVERVDAAPFRAIFCATAATLQVDDDAALDLPPFTLAWSAAAAGQRWRARPSGVPTGALEAWWLTVSPPS